VDAWPARRPIEVLAGRSARRPGSAYSVREPQQPSSGARPSSNFELRRANAMQSRRRGRSLRRFGFILGAGAVAIILVATLHGAPGNTDTYPVPSEATLAGLRVPQRIVAIRREPGRVQHRPFQLLLQQVQRLLGRRHRRLPERRECRGVVRRLRRLGLAEGRRAVHLRL
jgi:hypothetical protein